MRRSCKDPLHCLLLVGARRPGDLALFGAVHESPTRVAFCHHHHRVRGESAASAAHPRAKRADPIGARCSDLFENHNRRCARNKTIRRSRSPGVPGTTAEITDEVLPVVPPIRRKASSSTASSSTPRCARGRSHPSLVSADPPCASGSLAHEMPGRRRCPPREDEPRGRRANDVQGPTPGRESITVPDGSQTVIAQAVRSHAPAGGTAPGPTRLEPRHREPPAVAARQPRAGRRC